MTTATVVLAGGAAAMKGRSAGNPAPAPLSATAPPPAGAPGGAASLAPSASAMGSRAGSRPPAGTATAGPFRFLALGDWGRKGGANQTAVAAAMGARAAAAAAAGNPVALIISTGDNFYPWGLVSEGE